ITCAACATAPSCGSGLSSRPVISSGKGSEVRMAQPLNSAARTAMEKLNAEAAGLHIWLRTQANAPAQRPWFHDGGQETGGQLAPGRVGANQMKAAAHHWRWNEIGPYLDRIGEIARAATQNAELSPIEFADRQQFLLVNPGLGGRLQVASTIRCAVSIYNPGDVAPVHMHTPNASRTILSENGGYTTIEGERCIAARGDLLLTPNGTWHDHGNDGATPVVWADILDFPLLEFLDCSAQLLRAGEATGWKRETANAFYVALDGEGVTAIAGRQFDWRTNDLFVIPNFLWRRHINRGPRDAVLYLCSDRPLFEKIGQYRAQGRTPDGEVMQVVT